MSTRKYPILCSQNFSLDVNQTGDFSGMVGFPCLFRQQLLCRCFQSRALSCHWLPCLLTFILETNWSTCRKALPAWGDYSPAASLDFPCSHLAEMTRVKRFETLRVIIQRQDLIQWLSYSEGGGLLVQGGHLNDLLLFANKMQ